MHGCRNSDRIYRAVFRLLSKVRTGEFDTRGLEVRKVTVSIPEVHMSYLTVLADDEASDYDIKELANLLLESGDYQENLEYSHTMDMEMWDVTEEDV